MNPNPFPAIFILIGFVVITGGVWWISRPSALIVAGVMLLVLGLLGRTPGGR